MRVSWRAIGANAAFPLMHPVSERLARHICGQSADARVGGETFPTVAISAALNMTKEDLDLAANELEEQGLIRVHRNMGGPDVLMAEAELFRGSTVP